MSDGMSLPVRGKGLAPGSALRRHFARWLYALCAMLMLAGPVAAGSPGSARVEILAVVAQWYEELGKREDGRASLLVAPGFVDASPHYTYLDIGSAKLGPVHYTSLAATALKFAYDVDDVRIDPNFAKVRVWERGYFYAHAATQTYELAASTVFVLERRESDGRWLILAHRADSIGIPSNKVTDPMPDLSNEPRPPEPIFFPSARPPAGG